MVSCGLCNRDWKRSGERVCRVEGELSTKTEDVLGNDVTEVRSDCQGEDGAEEGNEEYVVELEAASSKIRVHAQGWKKTFFWRKHD